MQITNDIKYIGVNDHQIDLFEGQYEVPLGMAYNSYVIVDEKIAVMDTVDSHFTQEWLKQLEEVLNGKEPSYLIMHHMEPDHSSSVEAFLQKYPNTTLVMSQQAQNLLKQFYPIECTVQVVKEKDVLSLGTHELTFFGAPMVHWPEVMMSYETKDHVFFSADAFGKFGANDVEDPEGWTCEARRYYFGIVGKYGTQTQALLKKLEGLQIDYICSLHGPVLHETISECVSLYQTWSSYEAEEEGIFVAYASVYGHTKEVAELLVEKLKQKGYQNIKVADLCREDIYECVENAFRYKKMVLASVTYDAGLFPKMNEFLHHLVHRNYQKRTIGMIENGSWGPMAAKSMKAMLEPCKELTILEPVVTIRSAYKETDTTLDQLVDALIK